MPEIHQTAPHAVYVPRKGEVNAWDNEDFVRTVRATGNEKIQFLREVRDGQQASVETQVVSGNGDQTPIDYRLHNIDGQWMVYDVVIDNVSVVNNYRSQFERVIAKSSVQDLLRRMKNQDS